MSKPRSKKNRHNGSIAARNVSDGLYYNQLKFPVSESVYPLGKRTPVSHRRVFSTGFGITGSNRFKVPFIKTYFTKVNRHGGEEELLTLQYQGKEPMLHESQQDELAKHPGENSYLGR